MPVIRYLIAFMLLATYLEACRCEICLNNIPEEIQVPALNHCTEYTRFDPILSSFKGNNEDYQIILRSHLMKYNNVAGSKFVFPDGTTKEIYRSGYLGDCPEAMKELVQERKIETLINFHHTTKFDPTIWVETEKALFKACGGKNYIYITDFDYNFKNESEKRQVMKKITSIITLIRECEGNVLFHCMGGEHRSGIIYGILHKLYHSMTLEAIIHEYKCHTAWVSDELPGGYHLNNVELIEDYVICTE